MVQITPQTGGTVMAILADDTDFVKAGQPLVKLDTADAKVALDQAEANLGQAVRQVRTLYANNSTLKALDTSAKHYSHATRHARADTTALVIGRVLHAMVLDETPPAVAVYEGKVRRGEKWEAFAAEHEGETILKRDELEDVAAMRAAVLSHPRSAALFAEGTTVLRNIASWRVKETDRISAMATELRKLGATVVEGADFIEVTPPAQGSYGGGLALRKQGASMADPA